MKILIDHADIHEIKRIYDLYPVDGVTCNPTILTRTKRKPYEALKEIRAFIGKDTDLHVEVISKHAKDMIEEGRKIREVLGANTFIKIPVTPDGLKAIRILSSEGANTTGTIVYNPMQGYLAGKAGAKYVAPYVNRLETWGNNGMQIAKDIHDMLKKADLETELLAASFKNTQQVQELCKYGLGAATCSPEVIDLLIKNDLVAMQVDRFIEDFENLYGKGKTMVNVD